MTEHIKAGDRTGERGFTLVELLVVIGIIGILAAMLLPALCAAKARGQSASCKNLLREMSVALQVYADNNRQEYPTYIVPGVNFAGGMLAWFDSLYPPSIRRIGAGGGGVAATQWTNRLFHCPSYLAEGCMLYQGDSWIFDDRMGSYAYNWFGTGIIPGLGGPTFEGGGYLGIGQNAIGDNGRPTHDYQVVAPSEFFTMADARPSNYFFQSPEQGFSTNSWLGNDLMQIWAVTAPGSFGAGNRIPSEELLPPPHAQGYNVASADGHVSLVSRRNYLYPPVAASHWNRDNQAHLDDLRMIPQSQWSVTQ